ncbi:ESPR-type extended signal peptide-containing protein [Haemophilus influenzae]
MNKIFNVIWNVVTQTWVVVSELTRTHTKCASVTVATVVLATLFSATVQASDASEDEDLEPVVRTAVVLSFHSDAEGTGEKEATGDTNWGIYFDEKRVLRAGAITFKAGDNLKIKQNGKDFTYSLKKDLKGLTGVETEKLSFGANGNKVDITSDANGLKLAKTGNGNGQNSNVHLNGIASTLQDTLAGTQTTKVEKEANTITDEEKHRAASVQDVFNAGWNIKGVKTGITISDNVDFVRTYDTVEFLSADTETTTVTVDSKENGKRTEVKIGAKTSVIKEKDGKLFTGKVNKEANQVNGSTTDNADEGNGLVTAKEVIDAVNKAGWRVKTTTANGQNGDFATVASGTNVTFADGKGTTAVVTGDATNGITVKYDAKVGDGLKIGDDQKITADTVTLTVNSTDGDAAKPKGKVADIANEADKKKLVNAESLVTALNSLSWTAKADKEDDGEVDNKNTANGKEVKAGETVTFKAGKNLKVKQGGANFTYSLKEELTGLTSITLGADNGAKTVINKDGLTITPANGAGANNVNEISVTKDGIKAGNQQITNVASALTTYGATPNGAGTQPAGGNTNAAKNDLINLDAVTNTAAGGTATTDNGLKNKAATVGDLAGLGWVLSSDKTTKTDGTAEDNKPFHAAVKNANEVEFVGKNGATVSAKTDGNKHVVTVDVAEIKANGGLKKEGDTIKLNTKTSDDNLLTVNNDRTVEVTKGAFDEVKTDAPAAAGQGADTNNRGKVVVTGVADLTKATDADKKKVATVVDVAKAINDAATFVKVQSSDEDIENDAAGKDDTKDQSLKAGDTLTLKAGKNLKAKLDGKSVTFALAKDITTENATFSNKLSIGGAATTAPKVDITSTDDGLNFAQNGKAGKDAYVHLIGIATTLNEPASAGAKSTHVDLSLDDAKKSNAASIEDVLRAGWNIQGNDNNVDYVATYDTVNFKDDGKTTTVTVTQKANGKGADVAIGAKTSVIKEKDGKLFTGKDNKETNNVVSTTATDNADEGNGLVTEKLLLML